MVSEVKHPVMEGFYEIPGFPYLYINKKGVCWDEYLEEYVRPVFGMMPYPELRPKGMVKPVSVHRALALTFLECPGHPSNYQVDHDNGDKTDFELTNLKWVTRSENAIKAIKSGSRKDNRPLKVKNLATGEILHFHGVNEFGRYLGIHPGYISTYLKRPQSIPFRGTYEVVREGEPWVGFTKNDLGNHSNGKPKEVVTYNADNKSLTIYGSSSRAADALGVPYARIAKHCAEKSMELINGHAVSYMSDFIGNLENAVHVKSKRSENFDKNRFVKTQRPIEVFEVKTNKKLDFESTDEFARFMGVERKTIQKSMSVNAGYYKGYYIQFKKHCRQ